MRTVLFPIIILILQPLMWLMARALRWLFSLSRKGQYIIFALLFLWINALLASTLISFASIRLLANSLVLLWFATLTAITIYLLKRLIKGSDTQWRWAAILGFIGLLGLGVYNAYTLKVVHYTVYIEKPISPLKIGLASDLHLGSLFGSRQLDKLHTIFQAEKVDAILLAGDIMDDNTQAYDAKKMQAHLSQLRAPLGVYATMGNHDVFDYAPIAQAIRQAGIHLLEDEVFYNDKLALIGRNDDLIHNRPSAQTLSTQIPADIQAKMPVIIMDHRPSEILQNAQTNADIQVSGHTHNGQIFPFNFLVKALYPLHYGTHRFDHLEVIVSSGFGLWGVPMRLGSQSEAVIIHILPQNQTAQ